MKLSTLKIIINMMTAASKDETRYHLCGVNIQPLRNNKLRVQATDGHILSYVDIEDVELAKHIGENKNFVIPKEALPGLKAFCKTYGKNIDFDFELQDGLLKGPYGDATAFRSIDCKYPDTSKFFPNIEKTEIPENGPFTIGIDPTLIDKVYKSWGVKSKVVKFTFKNRLDALLVECKQGDITHHGIIMPLRV